MIKACGDDNFAFVKNCVGYKFKHIPMSCRRQLIACRPFSGQCEAKASASNIRHMIFNQRNIQRHSTDLHSIANDRRTCRYWSRWERKEETKTTTTTENAEILEIDFVSRFLFVCLFWKCANEPHDFQFTILSTNYLQIHCKSVLCGLRYACSKTNTKWIDRDRVNSKWFESFVAVNDSRENYFVFCVDGEFTSIPVAPASLS